MDLFACGAPVGGTARESKIAPEKGTESPTGTRAAAHPGRHRTGRPGRPQTGNVDGGANRTNGQPVLTWATCRREQGHPPEARQDICRQWRSVDQNQSAGRRRRSRA